VTVLGEMLYVEQNHIDEVLPELPPAADG